MDAFINRRDLAIKSLAGLAGGAVGWIPVEIVSHGHNLIATETVGAIIANLIAMALLSGLIGGAINATQSQELALTPVVKRRFIIGFVICALISLPTTYYSNRVFSYVLAAGGWGINHPGSIEYLIAGRLAGWMLMGLGLGLGVGIATFTMSNLLKGAAGGWVGGFIGGIAFDAIGALTHGGLFSRLFGLSAIGLAIGLFVGLVQELTKSAWLRVEAGRLQGREFRLEKPLSYLGRAEESDVGLFGDQEVAPRHAQIAHSAGQYVLKDLTRTPGTFVNRQRIESAILNNGDLIGIGGYAIRFHLRAGGVPQQSQSFVAVPPPSATNAEGPCLVDVAGRSTPLHHDAPTNIGRALDNDLVVGEPSVSRHHATIAPREGTFYLQDLNSQNGCYVDGRRVGEARLADGVRVKFGDAEFHFRA